MPLPTAETSTSVLGQSLSNTEWVPHDAMTIALAEALANGTQAKDVLARMLEAQVELIKATVSESTSSLPQ